MINLLNQDELMLIGVSFKTDVLLENSIPNTGVQLE